MKLAVPDGGTVNGVGGPVVMVNFAASTPPIVADPTVRTAVPSLVTEIVWLAPGPRMSTGPKATLVSDSLTPGATPTTCNDSVVGPAPGMSVVTRIDPAFRPAVIGAAAAEKAMDWVGWSVIG